MKQRRGASQPEQQGGRCSAGAPFQSRWPTTRSGLAGFQSELTLLVLVRGVGQYSQSLRQAEAASAAGWAAAGRGSGESWREGMRGGRTSAPGHTSTGRSDESASPPPISRRSLSARLRREAMYCCSQSERAVLHPRTERFQYGQFVLMYEYISSAIPYCSKGSCASRRKIAVHYFLTIRVEVDLAVYSTLSQMKRTLCSIMKKSALSGSGSKYC